MWRRGARRRIGSTPCMLSPEEGKERKERRFIRVYGKARYSQIHRYSQIQNGHARVFKHPGERDFPRKPLSPECLNTLAREILL